MLEQNADPVGARLLVKKKRGFFVSLDKLLVVSVLEEIPRLQRYAGVSSMAVCREKHISAEVTLCREGDGCVRTRRRKIVGVPVGEWRLLRLR
ncbi:unnamed protein product [Rangifer tarandus platyrhynchus]|uniref:Uncharacterized protein n=1 Tax=Rangifer tarandus platyrhynchus TaxID=3082113 RepID=A0ABN8XHZ1_RANTA|nr:unnamed protein product [Rangifer tarandus platyrhynchus]